MPTRAATRCWGLAVALVTLAGTGCGGKTARTPKPAPALAAYTYAWSAGLGAAEPVALAADAAHVFVQAGDVLSAFNVGDGANVWSLKDVRSGATLSADAGVLFATYTGVPAMDDRAAAAGAIDAIDAANGRRLWHHDLPPAPVAGPLLSATSAIVAAGRELHVWNRHDGALSWQVTLDTSVDALALDGSRVVVALSAPALAAIDLAKHAIDWQMPVDSPATALIAADRRIVVADRDGTLTAYHEDRRAPFFWRVYRVDAIAAPLLAARSLYVPEFDNTLRAYDFGNGTERWRVRLGSRAKPAMHIAGGQLFVPLLNGVMATCLAKTGEPSAEIPLSLPADSGSVEQRLEASGMTPDAGLLFRLVRPSSFSQWTLVASRRKDPAAK